MEIKIHTFMLVTWVSTYCYQQCRNFFFSTAHGLAKCCYDDNIKLTFNYWSIRGLAIYLKKIEGNNTGAYLYLRINPNKMLDNLKPDTLYSPTEYSNQLLLKNLEEILLQLPAQIDISKLHLFRLDLCKDCRISDSRVVDTYLDLLNRGVHDPQWEESSFGSEQDLHSFRRKKEKYQLTVYDKVYQMQRCGLQESWEHDFLLLRVEVALLADGIHHLSKKFGVYDCSWLRLLSEFTNPEHDIPAKIMTKLIPPGNYYSLAEAKNIIMTSNFHQNKKASIIEFLTGINQTSTISLAYLRQLKNGKKRLLQLAQLGINPVTIRARNHTPRLPSIYSLMEFSDHPAQASEFP